MAFVAVAIGGAALIGGGIALSNAQNAQNAQTQAADAANQTQLGMFNQQRQDNMPWLQAGQQSLGQLQTAMPDLTRKFSQADFQQDPGYQFALDQGMQAMQRSAAAKGMLNSVGTMQGLNNYAQGAAAQQYQNAYDRFTQNQNQRYNMMAGIAGTGQVANGQIGAAGQNAANQIGNNMTGAGNSRAAGSIGAANTINGTLGNGVNAWTNYTMMNNLMNKTPMPSVGGPSSAGFNGSSQLGSNLGPVGGGDYAPPTNYGLGMPSLAEN